MVAISSISIHPLDTATRVAALISMPDFSGEAWFELPAGFGVDEDGAADCFFVVGTILALGSDGVLTMDSPVSAQLIYNSLSVQQVLASWHPDKLGLAVVDVPRRNVDKPLVQDQTISCFTGGLDSFDTLLRNFDDIDSLLYVHGFDIGLAKTEIRNATSRHLKEVAAETGKDLIEVATNIRQFLNRAGSWPVITHGAALSAVGHLTSSSYGRLLIPSSHTYSDSYAWGSHPLVDHLWSSFRLIVAHDGAGSSRVQKTRDVASSPVAQAHLRVCWQNTGKYNCGVCDKCLRTMTALSLTGVLESFHTFPSELPLDKIAKLKVSGRSGRSFVVENLQYAEQQGATEIARILRSSIDDFDSRKRSKKRTSTVPATAEMGTRLAALENQVASMHRKNAAVESQQQRRLKALESKTHAMEEYWPIRFWGKFARWRHRPKQ